VRDLLIARIDEDAADDSAKTKLKATIRGLPAEMLSTLVKEAMKTGLAHIQDVGAWIHHLAT
jgi:hypothetical protein